MRAASFRNRYPIILVHGFCGWGRDEMLGFKYWGGTNDVEKMLNDAHFHCITATVGPFSSCWERAVELYHYIVGGTVDYGAAHAKQHGIERFGHTFPGIYPHASDVNRFHLIGHSFGGATIRQLENFLRKGSADEQKHYREHPEDGISELFLGGKRWVHSLTTLAAPHNGITTCYDMDRYVALVKQSMLHLAALSGVELGQVPFDFKLDQWGLKRKRGETFLEYQDRVFGSKVWESKDLAMFDFNIPGATEINRRLTIFDDTYYFSFRGVCTTADPVTGHAVPLPHMNPMMILPSFDAGRQVHEPPLPGGDAAWWPNDGVVNTISAKYPAGNPHRDVDCYELHYEPGIWNCFPARAGWDHIDFMGVNRLYLSGVKDVLADFVYYCQLITATESHANARITHGETPPKVVPLHDQVFDSAVKKKAVHRRRKAAGAR